MSKLIQQIDNIVNYLEQEHVIPYNNRNISLSTMDITIIIQALKSYQQDLQLDHQSWSPMDMDIELNDFYSE